MAWIESHQELRNHPKLSAVCRTLSAERPTIIGSLHLLWWWCMDHAMDGDLSRYSDQQIADAVEWGEDPETFVSALVSAGFIDRDDSGTKIHDWMDFCGELMAKRIARKEAKRRKTAENGSHFSPKSAEKPPTLTVSVPNHNQRKERKDSPRQKRAVSCTRSNELVDTNGRGPTDNAEDTPTHVAFVEGFGRIYEEKTGCPYKADKKDFVLAAGLLKKYGEQAIKEKAMALAILCNEEKAWFTKDGWASFSIGKLSAHWNALIPAACDDFSDKIRKETEKLEAEHGK